MSREYWAISGFGVCLDDIFKYLNKEKVNSLVRENNKSITFEGDVMEDDTFYGDPYANFAEFLCDFDSDNIFTYDDDGYGVAYFLYTPSYPWEVRSNEPTSLDDCQERILKILKKVYDAPDDVLKSHLSFISTIGSD